MNEYYQVHSLNSKLEEAWLKEYRSLGVNYYFENESVHSNLPGIERAKGLFYTKTPLIKIQVDAKEFQFSIAFGEKIWELIEVYEWNNKKHGFQE